MISIFVVDSGKLVDIVDETVRGIVDRMMYVRILFSFPKRRRLFGTIVLFLETYQFDFFQLEATTIFQSTETFKSNSNEKLRYIVNRKTEFTFSFNFSFLFVS